MIDTKELNRIFVDCLYSHEEITNLTAGSPPEGCIIVDGIISRFGFHPLRLESHRAEIKAMLDELPSQFKESTGGGWSFLNACMTKDDVQWGEHRNVEQLVTLGVGLKLVKYAMPKELWSILPGGMPYFTVTG